MESKKSHLILGMGEVGTAILRILFKHFDTDSIMKSGDTVEGRFEVLHVCFPYSEGFVAQVEAYKKQYMEPGGLVVIHSSVPVGTTDQISDAVHSPIRGVHPNLEQGIRTFVKYFGGPRADEAAMIFAKCGVKTATTSNAKNTEHAKLECTTAYGLMIALEKQIYENCQKYGTDFGIVYGGFTETYNQGYNELGMGNVSRPILKHVQGKIGGHCVIPNCKLLGGDIADYILKKNDTY